MPIAQVGHKEALWAPRKVVAEAYDYEGELAVIIGKPGRYIKRQNAFDHVAGYSCYNEGSVREYQGHNRQFGLGKNFERSGSFGPWLMTPDEFGDPATHTLITRLNGIERQYAKISGLLHDVPRLIEYLSEGYTLQPGDVIVTGSPGALPLRPGEQPEKPVGNVIVAGQLHMRTGDVCEVEVDGLGVLSNPVSKIRRRADASPIMRKGMRVRARFFSYVFAAAAMTAAAASIAVAEDYPTRTITDIVASTAGGGTDIISRIYGEQLSKQMGQPFIVENIAGRVRSPARSRRRGPRRTATRCRPD